MEVVLEVVERQLAAMDFLVLEPFRKSAADWPWPHRWFAEADWSARAAAQVRHQNQEDPSSRGRCRLLLIGIPNRYSE